MTKPDDDESAPPGKASKLPLLMGLCVALTGGAGAFHATRSGLLPFGESVPDTKGDAPQEAGLHAAGPAAGDVSFVPLEPMIVSVGPGTSGQHLRFHAQMEVAPGDHDAVQALIPRIMDVLNTYLRALEPGDLEAQSALTRLRAQMLRRIRIVTGGERVRDLLIMEFVLN